MLAKPFIHAVSNRKYARLSASHRLGRLHLGTAYAAGSVRACVFYAARGKRTQAGRAAVYEAARNARLPPLEAQRRESFETGAQGIFRMAKDI